MAYRRRLWVWLALLIAASSARRTCADTDIVRDALEHGDFVRARDILFDDLAAAPTDARRWYLLGYAQHELGDHAAAIDAMHAALNLGYDSPSLRQILGESLLVTGQYDAAQQHLERGPDTERNRLARAAAQRQPLDAVGVEPSRDREPFDFGWRLDLTLGHTSNVDLDGDGRDDLSTGATLDAWVRLLGDDATGLVARGGISTRLYPDVDAGDDLLLSTGVTAYHRVGSVAFDTSLGFRLAQLDGDTYAHILSWDFGAQAPLTPWWRLGTRYRLDGRDFHFDVTPEESRDGQLHQLTFTSDMDMPIADRMVALSVFGGLTFDQADGASSQSHGYFIGGRVEAPLCRHIDFTAGVTYSRIDFDHPHVATFFLSERGDDLWRIDVGLATWLAQRMRLSVGYQWSDLDSNLDRFDYDQSSVGVTLTIFGP